MSGFHPANYTLTLHSSYLPLYTSLRCHIVHVSDLIYTVLVLINTNNTLDRTASNRVSQNMSKDTILTFYVTTQTYVTGETNCEVTFSDTKVVINIKYVDGKVYVKHCGASQVRTATQETAQHCQSVLEKLKSSDTIPPSCLKSTLKLRAGHC